MRPRPSRCRATLRRETSPNPAGDVPSVATLVQDVAPGATDAAATPPAPVAAPAAGLEPSPPEPVVPEPVVPGPVVPAPVGSEPVAPPPENAAVPRETTPAQTPVAAPVAAPPPRIDAPAEIDAVAGRTVAFVVRADAPSAAAHEVPALTLADAPAGAVLEDRGDGTREFRWTPSDERLGETLVSFEARRADDPGSIALASTLVRVGPPPATASAGSTPAPAPSPAPSPAPTGSAQDAPGPVTGPDDSRGPASVSRFGEAPPLRELAARHGVRIGTASIHDDEATMFTIPESGDLDRRSSPRSTTSSRPRTR